MTWKQTGHLILAILIGAAMMVGWLLLPNWQITLILGRCHASARPAVNERCGYFRATTTS